MSTRLHALFYALSALLLLGVPAADAACPVGTPITSELSCSSNYDSFVDHTTPSFLGGGCVVSSCLLGEEFLRNPILGAACFCICGVHTVPLQLFKDVSHA